jgi:hypothetical protein
MLGIRRTRPLVRVCGAAVVALALAAGPMVGAASADLAGFSGSGSGFALRVVVDLSGLPDAVKAPIETAYTTFRGALGTEEQALLPETFPYTIDQRFIETLAEMGTASKGQALLSSGLIELSDKVEASNSGESKQVNTAAHSVPSADLPVVNVSAGELLAGITDGPSVSASGALTSVSATLEQLTAVFPAELETAFGDLTTAINGAVATAQGTLDTLLGDVAGSLVDQVADDDVLGGLLDDAGLGDVLGGADPVGDLTNELVSALQLSTITDLLAGSITSVNGLDNDSVTKKVGDNASADASSQIESVDALGLLNASAISLSSHSEAAGAEGSAFNTSECEIGAVRVGGTDGVSLDGETLYVAGTPLPVPVDQVDAVKSVVDDVLAAIGVVGDVGLCDKEGESDADGSGAAQRVSAFHVELALAAPADVPGALGIGAGDQLVRIVIDPTVETAVAAQVAPSVSNPEVSLPRTGAQVAITLLSGIGLAVGALTLRRRIF